MSIDRHILFYSRSRFRRNLFKYLRVNSDRILSIQKKIFVPFLLIALLSGCSGNSTNADSASASGATPIPATSTAITPPSTPSAAAASSSARVSTIPVALSIPDIDLTTTVVEMGWIVTEVGGKRTTRWAVPYSEAGWHVDSAGAGTTGNVVISGHQVVGEAIFAQLALGEIELGQEILVTDIRGEVFQYNVAEITDPIPLAGATEAEQTLSASYMAPSSTAKLTLMTGWPDFATTHYLFVVADYVGVAQ